MHTSVINQESFVKSRLPGRDFSFYRLYLIIFAPMRKLVSACIIVVLLSSCFRSKITVGEGPKLNQELTAKNHYLVYGLFPVKTADIKTMTAGSSHYEVELVMTPLDAVLASFTGGIYVPQTVIVKK